MIIVDEKDESIKTAQIKELANNVFERPIQGSKKIYIINNSENMTKEAQNSLLKTLEEPPEFIIIILITCNDNVILNTIKSRCLRIKFNSLSDEELKEYFINKGENINEELIGVFNGSLEKAIKIQDKIEDFVKIKEIIEHIDEYNELQILNLKETVFKDKDEIQDVLEYINTLLYNKLIHNIKNTEKYSKCIKIIEETKLRLKSNSNYDMTIDNCLLAIWEVFEING